jgi:ribose transport system permease protein
MTSTSRGRWLDRFLADYSMVPVLLAVCAFFSWATYKEQPSNDSAGGGALAAEIERSVRSGRRVLVVVRDTPEDAAFAAAVAARLQGVGGDREVSIVRGQPADAREALQKLAVAGRLDAIAANQATAEWTVLQDAGRRFPALGDVPVFAPRPYKWPTFLLASNLHNIASQIAIIAIIAIGMTMVIITGGIDLSVGSLIALSAVVSAYLIRNLAGAESATPATVAVCCLAAVVLCGLVGTVSGLLVTTFAVHSFLVTLAVMQIASGLAYRIAKGESIYELPDSFQWLGKGADLFHLSNSVVLMAALYVIAHVVMTRTVLGRYLYAVGGNAEAARLSGVPVRSVIVFAFAMSGALAGLGGVILASQLKSGSPTYGQGYELSVIAAVVVGGTSLSGGEGRVFGTLIGALLIAVIQIGMNLTNVESYTQKVVLGGVILAAVLLDRVKKFSWRPWSRRKG